MLRLKFGIALMVAAVVMLASASVQAACCAKDCAATGCNMVTVQTVAAPHIEASVFVNLRTMCNGALVKQCQSTFVVPPFQCCTTAALIGKCHLLAQSIRLNPDCQDLGYSVVETCDLNQTFKVTDASCASGVTELGIACGPNTFTATGAGETLKCDYEGDLITPGCPDATLGVGDESVGSVTLRGRVAVGDTLEPVVPGHPPAEHLFVKHPSVPSVVELIEEVAPGMTAAEVLAGLARSIDAAFGPSFVKVTSTDGGETLMLQGLRAGAPVAIGAALANNAIATDPATGDRHGFEVGTRNTSFQTQPIAPELPRGPKSGKPPRPSCSAP